MLLEIQQSQTLNFEHGAD